MISGFLRFLYVIRALCRLPYLVVGMFQNTQYLVVIFLLFHVFRDYLSADVDILLT